MPDLTSVFVPLAFLIGLGFLLGRALPMDLKTVASLAIYGFTPIVAFGATAQMKVEPSLLLLPVVVCLLATAVGLGFLWIGRKCLKDTALPYLLPIATGSGNTGYFGLPVALAVFGQEAAGVYLLANLGVVIFESTFGYYFIGRGEQTRRQAMERVLKLPVLYALMAGLLFSACQLELPAAVFKLWELAKGAFVCVGMMIIGLALSKQERFALSAPLLLVALAGKFVAWPLMAIAFVLLDQQILHLLTPLMHGCIVLMSLAPMAANLAAYAAQHNMRVDQAAGLILCSTVIAVLGLPLVLPSLLHFLKLT
jgi:predicted permease